MSVYVCVFDLHLLALQKCSGLSSDDGGKCRLLGDMRGDSERIKAQSLRTLVYLRPPAVNTRAHT